MHLKSTIFKLGLSCIEMVLGNDIPILKEATPVSSIHPFLAHLYVLSGFAK